jgi:hypothetical protein
VLDLTLFGRACPPPAGVALLTRRSYDCALMRDLRLACGRVAALGLGWGSSLILAVLVPLGAWGRPPQTLALIAPGILWVGALLACLLSLDRIFALDFEDGSLDLLATSPIPLEGWWHQGAGALADNRAAIGADLRRYWGIAEPAGQRPMSGWCCRWHWARLR